MAKAGQKDAPLALVPAATKALADTVAERLRDTIFMGQLPCGPVSTSAGQWPGAGRC